MRIHPAGFLFFATSTIQVYLIMEGKAVLKKNPCPDCTFCQYCSKTRCSMCLPKGCKKREKEQKGKTHIPLFRSY